MAKKNGNASTMVQAVEEPRNNTVGVTVFADASDDSRLILNAIRYAFRHVPTLGLGDVRVHSGSAYGFPPEIMERVMSMIPITGKKPGDVIDATFTNQTDRPQPVPMSAPEFGLAKNVFADPLTGEATVVGYVPPHAELRVSAKVVEASAAEATSCFNPALSAVVLREPDDAGGRWFLRFDERFGSPWRETLESAVMLTIKRLDTLWAKCELTPVSSQETTDAVMERFRVTSVPDPMYGEMELLRHFVRAQGTFRSFGYNIRDATGVSELEIMVVFKKNASTDWADAEDTEVVRAIAVAASKAGDALRRTLRELLVKP